MSTKYPDWETIIGLEIHVQLNTKTKLFSRDPNRYGDEPNTNISVISTGQPGTLPVLNKEVVKKAVQFGCAVGGDIRLKSKFDRKTYFYPDAPRNFQITQFDKPIMLGGEITADVHGESKTFQIDRAHIEDDSGMLKHFSNFAGVDYNRAGVPLIEIVSEPCLRSPADAAAYATAIRSIMMYIGAANCNMEEGGMRFDANISVRKKGETTFRSKIEIKNMNSFRNMEKAIEHEAERQIKIYEENSDHYDPALIIPGTYKFDLEKQKTVLMRAKEDAADYLYFPEPDLPPLILTDEYVEQIRSELPELPQSRYNRYVDNYKLAELHASILVNNKPLSDFFDEAIKHHDNKKSVCNWILAEFTGRLKEKYTTLPECGIKPRDVAALVALIDSEKITGRTAKEMADIMVENPGKSPDEIVKENPGFETLSDTSAIEAVVDEVLAEFPDSIEAYKNGKDRAFSFLVGQVMKRTRGQAQPAIVNSLLLKKI